MCVCVSFVSVVCQHPNFVVRKPSHIRFANSLLFLSGTANLDTHDAVHILLVVSATGFRTMLLGALTTMSTPPNE